MKRLKRQKIGLEKVCLINDTGFKKKQKSAKCVGLITTDDNIRESKAVILPVQ